MGETDQTWLALSLTGLALATASLLVLEGVGPVVEYSFVALTVLLGAPGVWGARRGAADD